MTISQLGVPTPLVAFYPPIRKEVEALYPGAKFNGEPRVLDEDELIQFLSDCDAAIIGFEHLTERVLAALPNLKVIGKFGAGLEKIDFTALRRHNVRFGYQFGVNALAVAELTIGFMLAALRWVTPLNVLMRAGARPERRNGRNLTGRVVGIHGCGNIGKQVIRLLHPFECEILACDIKDYPEFYRKYAVAPVSFETLLARSEVLSLHLPKTRLTRNLYDQKILSKLRPDCVLINTCRGGIVNEDALLERLESGKLVAAASDVFEIEPCTNDRLLRHENLLATPHIGASTDTTRIAMGRAALRGLTENALVRPGQYDYEAP